LPWAPDPSGEPGRFVTYGEVRRQEEYEHSKHSFELADIDTTRRLFDMLESESGRLAKQGAVFPAYDACLKCSHLFNILAARRRGARRRREDRIHTARPPSGGRLRETLPGLARGARIPAAARRAGRDGVTMPQTKKTFLLEVGCEEMPALVVPSALGDLSHRL